MKSKLPIITVVLAAVVCAPLAFAEQAAESEVTQSGQEMIADAARRLSSQPSVAAKIRQRASLFGRDLVGSGAYRQMRAGGKMLIRLELKLQVGGEITSLQQVNDGATLWIRRDVGDASTTGYVNLGKLSKASSGASASDAAWPTADAMALGGLQQLLLELHGSFLFGVPVSSQLGAVPVWTLHGQWKPEMLAAFFPDQKEAILAGESPRTELLPDHVPDTVTLVLGRDEFIPLFPYRIEYSRRIVPAHAESRRDSNSHATATGVRPLVTMELFEVQRRVDQDPSLFIYKLGNQHVEDWTERFMRRLQVTTD
ncbi:MAG: hypothetical protein ACC645_09005 [Pirellulales bacterium]